MIEKEQLKQMTDNDGVYILGDASYPEVDIPIVSSGGILFSINLDEGLRLDGFTDSAFVQSGPHRVGRSDKNIEGQLARYIEGYIGAFEDVMDEEGVISEFKNKWLYREIEGDIYDVHISHLDERSFSVQCRKTEQVRDGVVATDLSDDKKPEFQWIHELRKMD